MVSLAAVAFECRVGLLPARGPLFLQQALREWLDRDERSSEPFDKAGPCGSRAKPLAASFAPAVAFWRCRPNRRRDRQPSDALLFDSLFCSVESRSAKLA